MGVIFISMNVICILCIYIILYLLVYKLNIEHIDKQPYMVDDKPTCTSFKHAMLFYSINEFEWFIEVELEFGNAHAPNKY